MANEFYAKGKEKVLTAAINWLTDDIRVALVRNTYPQNLATDEFYTSIATYVVNTPASLAGKSITNGIYDANNVNFVSVAPGDTLEGVVLYKWTGSAATSPLLIYVDTITGFPLVTNGSDVLVQWDDGAFKIFSL